MDPNELDLVVKYLVSRLDEQGKADVKEILGGEMPDPAQDALRGVGMDGVFALKRWPRRLIDRAVRAQRATSTMAADGGPAETDAERRKRMFPHMDRLKVL